MPRKVEFTKAGQPSTIRVVDMVMPEPKTGQVRVKVAFAGINFADLLMRLGFYQPRPPYPFTPGYEISGVIDAVADENALFKSHALCEAHDPKSHAPGVSSRPRHRAHRRAGKTHERSKGESSDMPPRGMSAEVRALSSAPLRRGAQNREMRSETRATRGA